jgi:hypothetical protein
MIVAASASDPLAEECFCAGFSEIDGIFVKHEIVQRAVLTTAAGTGENLVGELVPRFVLLDALADPIVEGPHGGGVETLA